MTPRLLHCSNVSCFGSKILKNTARNHALSRSHFKVPQKSFRRNSFRHFHAKRQICSLGTLVMKRNPSLLSQTMLSFHKHILERPPSFGSWPYSIVVQKLDRSCLELFSVIVISSVPSFCWCGFWRHLLIRPGV